MSGSMSTLMTPPAPAGLRRWCRCARRAPRRARFRRARPASRAARRDGWPSRRASRRWRGSQSFWRCEWRMQRTRICSSACRLARRKISRWNAMSSSIRPYSSPARAASSMRTLQRGQALQRPGIDGPRRARRGAHLDPAAQRQDLLRLLRIERRDDRAAMARCAAPARPPAAASAPRARAPGCSRGRRQAPVR